MRYGTRFNKLDDSVVTIVSFYYYPPNRISYYKVPITVCGRKGLGRDGDKNPPEYTNSGSVILHAPSREGRTEATGHVRREVFSL